MKTRRIQVIDSFRLIAITMVALFHYCTKWTLTDSEVSLYPYSERLNFFHFGRLGVHFFFIISGFVIAFSLKNSNGIKEFFVKRLSRILPSLFFISSLTFIVFYFFDPDMIFPHSHSIKNLLVSLILVKPGLFNVFFENRLGKLEYVNGSYWSLWPEIQFYFIAAILFFMFKKHFLKIFFILTTIISILFLIFKHQLINLEHQNLMIIKLYEIFDFWAFQIFNVTEFLNWFCIGIIFFLLFNSEIKKNKAYLLIAVNAIMILAINPFIDVIIVFPIMLLAFIILIEKPHILFFLEYKILFLAGAASYNFYLIHEHIGVLMIKAFGKILPNQLILITPFLVYLIVIVLSIIIYNLYEKRATKILLSALIKRNN